MEPVHLCGERSRALFCTHRLHDGDDIGPIQEPLGHWDVKTTMIYTHVLNRRGNGSIARWTGSQAGGQHHGVRGIDCTNFASNPLTRTWSRIRKGARMQVILRGYRLLGVGN